MNKISLFTHAILLFLGINVSIAFAGNAENIEICVLKAKEFANVTLEPFNAVYESNWIAFDVAKWNNTTCEISSKEVYYLKINGVNYVYRWFAGENSYILNNTLEERTENAISKLESRISLLKQRMKKTTDKLKLFNPDHEELENYINEGIKKAL